MHLGKQTTFAPERASFLILKDTNREIRSHQRFLAHGKRTGRWFEETGE
jgi:hypothetical protein